MQSTETATPVREFSPNTEEISRVTALMMGLARRQLSDALQRVVEPMDIVQDAWLSYVKGGALAENYREFCGLMKSIVCNMVLNCNRDHTAQRRTHFRRISLHNVERNVATKKEQTSMDELLEPIDPAYHELLRMRMDGYSYRAIADHLGCHERTLRKDINRIRSTVDPDVLHVCI